MFTISLLFAFLLLSGLWLARRARAAAVARAWNQQMHAKFDQMEADWDAAESDFDSSYRELMRSLNPPKARSARPLALGTSGERVNGSGKEEQNKTTNSETTTSNSPSEAPSLPDNVLPTSSSPLPSKPLPSKPLPSKPRPKHPPKSESALSRPSSAATATSSPSQTPSQSSPPVRATRSAFHQSFFAPALHFLHRTTQLVFSLIRPSVSFFPRRLLTIFTRRPAAPTPPHLPPGANHQ